MQRLQREGRVAHPGEAVVPVALAARRLGQRGGERGHRRAGRHVGEALDRERRALDRVAPAVVGQARARPASRASSACVAASRALASSTSCGDGEALGPGERAVDLLALLERVARAHPVALDAERHVGLQPDRLAGAASRRPCGGRRRPATTPPARARSRSTGSQTSSTSTLPSRQSDRAHQHVVAVVVGRAAGCAA